MEFEYPWLMPFSQSVMDCVGGRKLGDDVVWSINQSICSRPGNNIYILILGSNNIRSKGQAKDIKPFFEQVLQHASGFKNTHIALWDKGVAYKFSKFCFI